MRVAAAPNSAVGQKQKSVLELETSALRFGDGTDLPLPADALASGGRVAFAAGARLTKNTSATLECNAPKVELTVRRHR